MELTTGSLGRSVAMLLCISGMLSCRGAPPHENVVQTPGLCPASRTPAVPGRVVRARYSPFEIQLPADFRERQGPGDRGAPGEAWRGPQGMVVSYTQEADPAPFRPVGADEQVTDCSEVIDGRPAHVRLLYSRSTYVPGQSAVSRWKLPNGEFLTLQAFSPDSARKGELMAIIRSVRFLPGDSASAAAAGAPPRRASVMSGANSGSREAANRHVQAGPSAGSTTLGIPDRIFRG